MQFPDLPQPRILPVDLAAQSLGDQVEVGKMQEEHGVVKSLPKVAFGAKLRVFLATTDWTQPMRSARAVLIPGAALVLAFVALFNLEHYFYVAH